MNEDDDFFAYGDHVEHKLNSNVRGIVIGSSDFGCKYTVRLAPSLATMEFHGVELRRADDNDYLPDPEEIEPDNVVNFTKARGRLTAKTKTKGAA